MFMFPGLREVVLLLRMFRVLVPPWETLVCRVCLRSSFTWKPAEAALPVTVISTELPPGQEIEKANWRGGGGATHREACLFTGH